jgi:hypothetical protein
VLAGSGTRSLVLALTLAGCVGSSGGKVETDPPQLEAQPGGAMPVRDVALPMHGAAIVDLAFLEPSEGGRWRLISADADGWVRVWQDGKLRSAVYAHRGGTTVLIQSPEGIPFTAGMDGRVIEWSRDGERIERVLLAREPVGTKQGQDEKGGEAAEALRPSKPRPIIAMTLTLEQLAISDGHWVQVWSREPTPRLIWSQQRRAFVSGLALTRDGSALAMAQLREDAFRRGIADHPAAEYADRNGNRREETREQEVEEALELTRMQARVDRPGATADFVEVCAVNGDWDVALEPAAPIDPDLSMPEPGLVIYREVYAPDVTRVVGRSIGDRVTLGVRVGVIATPASESDLPAPEQPGDALADFAFGRGVELDQPPIGIRLEPYDALPIAGHRELAIGAKYWAAGDEHGQIVIGPREGGELEWLPAVEPIKLIATAAHEPWLVTSGLEQPVRIRRWQLAQGTQRLVGMILPPQPNPETGQIPPALYPVELAIDDSGNRVAVSSWSFSAEQTSELRLFDLAASSAKVVEQIATPEGLEIALAPTGDTLWSWHQGSLARSFTQPDWASTTTQGLGRPLPSADGRWLAFVAPARRQIFDRQEQGMIQDHKLETTLASEFVSAVASDGTLAVVVPIGGGTIERLHPTQGVLPPVTTFGPVTALAWLPTSSTSPDALVIGQDDGSIELLEPGSSEPRPLRPAEGGRVWALAGVGGSKGAFAELDEQGLWIHRLSDAASLSVSLASPEPLVTDKQSHPSPANASQGLVVVWRASAGARACRVFDATTAGVVASEGVTIERDDPKLLADFLSGVVACEPREPVEAVEPATIEPVP